jgi:hypothetical protein
LLIPLHSGEVVIPENTPVDRYQAIWVRSPFTAASVNAEDKASGSWALVGLAGSKDDPMVFLQNRETQERMTVTKNTNEKGFMVLTMEPQTDLSQSTAHIRTPDQDLVVKFDKDLMAISNPPVQPMPAVFSSAPSRPNPGAFGMPGTIPHPIHHINIPSPPPPPPAPAGALKK